MEAEVQGSNDPLEGWPEAYPEDCCFAAMAQASDFMEAILKGQGGDKGLMKRLIFCLQKHVDNERDRLREEIQRP